jgi:hypothetical protein
MESQIAQSAKLMFETYDAELGDFPALFGHKIKSDVKLNFEQFQKHIISIRGRMQKLSPFYCRVSEMDVKHRSFTRNLTINL